MNIATQTKTIVDVRRVLNSFGADYSMLGQSTGLRTRSEVETTVGDLILFANAGYLLSVRIILWDANSKKIRGRRYVVSNGAVGWTSDQPGDNLWPRTPRGRLQLIATLSDDWWRLDEGGKDAEKLRLGITGDWAASTGDTSLPGMTAVRDRQYASNGFGLERWTYR